MDDQHEWCQRCDKEVVKGTICPRAVACPTCDAKPDQWCQRPSGHRAQHLHIDRIHRAETIDYENGAGPHPATIRNLA